MWTPTDLCHKHHDVWSPRQSPWRAHVGRHVSKTSNSNRRPAALSTCRKQRALKNEPDETLLALSAAPIRHPYSMRASASMPASTMFLLALACRGSRCHLAGVRRPLCSLMSSSSCSMVGCCCRLLLRRLRSHSRLGGAATLGGSVQPSYHGDHLREGQTQRVVHHSAPAAMPNPTHVASAPGPAAPCIALSWCPSSPRPTLHMAAPEAASQADP